MADPSDTKTVKAHEEFVRLTIKALREEKADAFLDTLLQRRATFETMEGEEIMLDEGAIGEWLSMETDIVRRLDDIRSQTIKDIDQYSMNMKSARVYGARFPFPMIPVFLSQSA